MVMVVVKYYKWPTYSLTLDSVYWRYIIQELVTKLWNFNKMKAELVHAILPEPSWRAVKGIYNVDKNNLGTLWNCSIYSTFTTHNKISWTKS